jgi:hypothetical protein
MTVFASASTCQAMLSGYSESLCASFTLDYCGDI